MPKQPEPRRCKRNHVLDEFNAHVNPKGSVVCNQCIIERRRGLSDGEGETVACLLCGRRLRVLGNHLKRMHGLDAAQRKAYPGALSAPIFHEIQRDLYADGLANEVALTRRGKPNYDGWCKQGLHRLRSPNVWINSRGERQCLACKTAWRRAWERSRRDLKRRRHVAQLKELEHLGCQACERERAKLPLTWWLANRCPRRLLCERHLLWAREQDTIFRTKHRETRNAAQRRRYKKKREQGKGPSK